MSAAYTRSIWIAGKPCPPSHSFEGWIRHKQIARDNRLSRIDPAVLPDSFSALYELSKMTTSLLNRIVELGLVTPESSTRFIRLIRRKKKVPLITTIWTDLEEYEDVASRIEEVRAEFG